ncbi:MAG: hypothetical protein SFW66_09000 [Gammaproteobacteria bacterium]|nr:hypothetical protein [Gammaproteobacteria bacterium]
MTRMEVALKLRDVIGHRSDFSYSNTWVKILDVLYNRANAPEIRLKAHEALDNRSSLKEVLDVFIKEIFGEV